MDKQTIEDIENAIESLAWLKTGESICVDKEEATEGKTQKWLREPSQ